MYIEESKNISILKSLPVQLLLFGCSLVRYVCVGLVEILDFIVSESGERSEQFHELGWEISFPNALGICFVIIHVHKLIKLVADL